MSTHRPAGKTCTKSEPHKSHLPTHSSREIVIIFGSLTTCDPGNIHDTMDACVKDKIRINIVALAAEMKICREFCDKTGGQFSWPCLISLYTDFASLLRHRSIWSCPQRWPFQRPAFRANTSASPATGRAREGYCESCCRPHDDGLPHTSPRNFSAQSLCLPL